MGLNKSLENKQKNGQELATDREKEVLELITDSPMISQQELAERLGITRSSVAVHISNLMRKGIIQGKGYVLTREPYVAVVGGVNIDISGYPDKPLIMQDSNPGHVRHSLGGAGRNVAHNLRLLGVNVRLMTVFGEDMYADMIRKSCSTLGIDITDSLTVRNAATSTYVFITDNLGDKQLAISDMAAYDHLTPSYIGSRMGMINKAQVCVVDTNISEESLDYLMSNSKVPLFVDTISISKSGKLKHVFDRIHTLVLNKAVAEVITEIKITDESSFRSAGKKLMGFGIVNIFILSSQGAYCCGGSGSCFIPAYASTTHNTSGIRDSFMSAIVWAFLQNKTLEDMGRIGMAAASVCMDTMDVVNTNLSVDTLSQIVGK